MTPRRLIEPARLAGTPLLRTQSDARLVDLVRAGHASAFEAIVQRYRKALLNYCSRLLPASRAEDAVQQTFLKAYQAMISGDSEILLRPWLYRIAHNASLNLLRQNGWSHDQLDENMDGVQRPDQAFELRERLEHTVRAVKNLPERQRDAVLLREIDGLSYEEIALALGVGDGAVRQLLHRARATLRSAATAVTPVGLVERLASAITSADPATRIAEATAGIGAGLGAAKIGAAMLATGALATGVATVPLSHHSSRSSRSSDAQEAAVVSKSAIEDAGAGSTTADDNIQRKSPRGRSHSGHGRHGRRSGRHSGHDGSGGRSGTGGRGERSGGSGESHNGGSGDGRDGGGSGDKSSGSGERRSGSRDGGGSSDGSGSGEERKGSSSGGDGGTTTQSGDGEHDGSDGEGSTITQPTQGTTAPAVSDGGGSGSGGSGSGDGGDSRDGGH